MEKDDLYLLLTSSLDAASADLRNKISLDLLKTQKGTLDRLIKTRKWEDLFNLEDIICTLTLYTGVFLMCMSSREGEQDRTAVRLKRIKV